MTWTPERVEELTRLWGAGHSASAIGKRLGVSKNAVVGKAHRLKLPSRPSPIRKDSRPAPRRRLAPLVQPAPVEDVQDAPAEAAVPAPRLREPVRGQTCQWPIGDPAKADFHFCGGEVVAGKPYCDKHCAVAYIGKSRSNDSEAA